MISLVKSEQGLTSREKDGWLGGLVQGSGTVVHLGIRKYGDRYNQIFCLHTLCNLSFLPWTVYGLGYFTDTLK